MSRRRRAASCLTGEARPDDDGDSEVSSFEGETGRHGGAGVGLEDRSADAGKKEAGIVGDVEGEPIVASPLHKQRFSLLDGRCLDDPDVALTTYVTRIVDGVVLVARP